MYGHNNYEGNGFGLTIGNEQEFVFSAKYIKAQVIEENAFQSDMELLTLNLVKHYEI